MSKQSPYDNISISEGGRFVRYEWDVHYLTDEQLETLRKHVETLQTENAKLRELVARLICHIENPPCESCIAEMSCAGGEGLTNCDEYQFMVCDARELGVEV